MTIYEASVEAMRELGVSEEEIRARDKFATLKVPFARQELSRQIEPGQERSYIDSLKNFHQKLQKLSSEDLEAMRIRLENDAHKKATLN